MRFNTLHHIHKMLQNCIGTRFVDPPFSFKFITFVGRLRTQKPSSIPFLKTQKPSSTLLVEEGFCVFRNGLISI
jgi:hypothetical protein